MITSFRLQALALTTVLLAGAACSPVVATRGHIVDEERLAAVQEGVSRMDEVAAILGSPSTTGTFDGNTWYYIGQVTEKTAFFRPEAVERKVLIVRFDDGGTVREKRVLDLADAREVEITARETPTAGREMSFLEQFLGNIGRFSGKDREGGPGAPVGR